MCYKYVMFGGTGTDGSGGENSGSGLMGWWENVMGKTKWRLFVLLWTTVRWEVMYKQLLTLQYKHTSTRVVHVFTLNLCAHFLHS